MIDLMAGDSFEVGLWSGDSLYETAHLEVTNFNQVPEPATLTLLALSGLALLRRR